MATFDFLKRTPARLTNDSILRDVSTMIDNLSRNTLPNVKRIADRITASESPYILQAEKELKKEKAYKDKCYFRMIEIAGTNALGYLTYVYHNKHIFEDTVVTSGMTVDKATHLGLLSVAKFFAMFTAKLVDFAIACELSELSKKEQKKNKNAQPWDMKTQYSPGKIKDCESLMGNYVAALKIFSITEKEINSGIAKLPAHAIVTEMTEQTLGHTHDLDPVRLSGFIPIDLRYNLNPIYYIGSLLADIDNWIYSATKDEYNLAMARLQEYEAMADNGGSAAAQRGIEHYRNKVEILERQIREYEEKHG